MKVLKQLLLIVVTTMGIAYLLKWSSDNFGFRSIAFSFLANFLIVVWIVLLSQSLIFTFPPSYFAIKRFEKDGRLYEKLGIHAFKKLVQRGPLSIFSPTLRFSGSKAGLPRLDYELRKAEAGHLTIILVILVFAGMAAVRGWFDVAGWMLLFSFLLNGYPIMLQRYNRIRLQQIDNRKKPSKKSKR